MKTCIYIDILYWLVNRDASKRLQIPCYNIFCLSSLSVILFIFYTISASSKFTNYSLPFNYNVTGVPAPLGWVDGVQWRIPKNPDR